MPKKLLFGALACAASLYAQSETQELKLQLQQQQKTLQILQKKVDQMQ